MKKLMHVLFFLISSMQAMDYDLISLQLSDKEIIQVPKRYAYCSAIIKEINELAESANCSSIISLPGITLKQWNTYIGPFLTTHDNITNKKSYELIPLILFLMKTYPFSDEDIGNLITYANYLHIEYLVDTGLQCGAARIITNENKYRNQENPFFLTPYMNERLLKTLEQKCITKVWKKTNTVPQIITHNDDDPLPIAFNSTNDFAIGFWKKGKIKTFDRTTGTCIKTFTGHSNTIRSLTFSPDNKILVSGSDEGLIELWDSNTTQKILTLYGHLESIRALMYSPDGTKLTSGSTDKTIKLWSNACRTHLKTLNVNEAVYCLAFYDENTLLAGTEDGNIQFWDIENEKNTKNLSCYNSPVFAIALNAHKNRLFSAARLNINIWDALTGEFIQSLQGHTHAVRDIKLSSDENIIASSSYDQTIKLWDSETGNLIKTFYQSGWANSIAFSPNGDTIASTEKNGSTQLWKKHSCKSIPEILNFIS